VVVAAIPIPWGAKLDSHYLKVIRIPPADTPQGAYANVGQILNQDGGPPVALAAMAAQEPVLASKLTGPGERQTLAALVAPGMRAYTISVTAATAGGGHIMPGDRVDVVYSHELPTPIADAGNGKLFGAGVLIQSVRVLGVDLNANPTSTQPAVPSTATLEVSMQDAEKLALAVQGGGTLSLALRRPGQGEIDSAAHAIVDDSRISHTPRQPRDGAPVAAARTNRPRSSADGAGVAVTVVSGDAATDIHVPFERAGR
jgi:pilus assembly protein CpaB